MSDEPAPPRPARRVVVAEDEALIRLDVVEMLRDGGFDVVGEAGDGEQAVRLAEEHRPDLVVLDVKMPVLDGISAAERIVRARIARLILENGPVTAAALSTRLGLTPAAVRRHLDNLLAGGAFTLYCEQSATGNNYRVMDNHFSTRFKSSVGFYGSSTDCSDETQSGNVIQETGLPLKLG